MKGNTIWLVPLEIFGGPFESSLILKTLSVQNLFQRIARWVLGTRYFFLFEGRLQWTEFNWNRFESFLQNFIRNLNLINLFFRILRNAALPFQRKSNSENSQNFKHMQIINVPVYLNPTTRIKNNNKKSRNKNIRISFQFINITTSFYPKPKFLTINNRWLGQN